MSDLLQLCEGRLPERIVAAGEVVMAEGGRAGVLLVLAEGTVEILKGEYQINIISDPGAVFGEISVLLETPHSATVKAITPARFFVVEQPLEVLRSSPELALGVAHLLAQRLNAMTTYLADLKSQFEDHDNHLGMIDVVLDALTHAQHQDHSPGSDRDPDPNVD